MRLDELQAEWEVDCNIDQTKPDVESARSPHLHSKYINELVAYKLKLVKSQADLNELIAKKRKYYRGEMTREELEAEGWQQWQLRSLKSEIDQLIEADPDVVKIVTREQYLKITIMFLESVLGEIRSRSFNCKNIIEFAKFRAGA